MQCRIQTSHTVTMHRTCSINFNVLPFWFIPLYMTPRTVLCYALPNCQGPVTDIDTPAVCCFDSGYTGSYYDFSQCTNW